MNDDLTHCRIRGHRANLERYARLLATTNFTDLERKYIHRRISEEHLAIEKLQARIPNPDVLMAMEPRPPEPGYAC